MAFWQVLHQTVTKTLRACFSSGLGELGGGAGKGGGGGGAIRNAGGSLGRREVALEESYFRKMDKNKLDELRVALEEEAKFHTEQIERHKEALKKTKSELSEVNDEEK